MYVLTLCKYGAEISNEEFVNAIIENKELVEFDSVQYDVDSMRHFDPFYKNELLDIYHHLVSTLPQEMIKEYCKYSKTDVFDP